MRNGTDCRGEDEGGADPAEDRVRQDEMPEFLQRDTLVGYDVSCSSERTAME